MSRQQDRHERSTPASRPAAQEDRKPVLSDTGSPRRDTDDGADSMRMEEGEEDEEEEEEDLEAAAMAQMMGFGGFSTSKVGRVRGAFCAPVRTTDVGATLAAGSEKAECRGRGGYQEAADVAAIYEPKRRIQQVGTERIRPACAALTVLFLAGLWTP